MDQERSRPRARSSLPRPTRSSSSSSSLSRSLLFILIPCLILFSQPALGFTPDPASPTPQTLRTSLIRLVKSHFLPPDASEQLERRAADDAEAGVTRLTDLNFDAYVTGRDVWVVLVHGTEQDPLSQLYTEVHKNATEIVQKAAAEEAEVATPLTIRYDTGDEEGEDENSSDEERKRSGLARFKFARVDYMTEVEMCTRWLIFKPPYIVIIKNEQSVRFLAPRQLPSSGEFLADLLVSGDWETAIQPWTSRYGPGGDREWVIEGYLYLASFWSTTTGQIPNVVWIFVTGAIGQSLIRWMHSGAGGAGGVGAGVGDEAARQREARRAERREAERKRYADAARRDEERRVQREAAGAKGSTKGTDKNKAE